jgi:hypothetical protein
MAVESMPPFPEGWGWYVPTAELAADFERQLAVEIGSSHMLVGIAVKVVGYRNGTDDILCRHESNPSRFTVVHLAGALPRRFHLRIECRIIRQWRPTEALTTHRRYSPSDYLNDHLENVYLLFRQQKDVEEFAFRETFRALNEQLGDDSFRKYDAEKDRFLGAFSIAGFEAVALGLGYNVKKQKPITMANLRERVQSIWKHDVFVSNSGSGVRANQRIPKIVPLGRQLLAP